MSTKLNADKATHSRSWRSSQALPQAAFRLGEVLKAMGTSAAEADVPMVQPRPQPSAYAAAVLVSPYSGPK
jgi:hypothetical protein